MAPLKRGRSAHSEEVNLGIVGDGQSCPFKFFHSCKYDNSGSSRLLGHLKRDHLSWDDGIRVLRDAISVESALFGEVGEALRFLSQWLCVRCMSLHALSRGCHHEDGIARFTSSSGDADDFIVGIPKPRQPLIDQAHVSSGGIVVDGALLERVFAIPMVTVKSIPHTCRMAFAQALTGSLRKVLATPGSVESWVKLLLLPRCTLQVVRPASRQERRSGNRKSMQCGSIMRALAVWKDGVGLEDLVLSLLAQSSECPSGRLSLKDTNEKGASIKQCLRKVADGHFTAAEPPNLPTFSPSEHALQVDADYVLGCVKSFPKGTSCGKDGLRAQHILDALSGKGASTASGLLAAITEVVNLWLGGFCPRVLAEFIASAPLTPLLKPDNGIRPIAVGAIWRRLVSKVAMHKFGKEMASHLGDYQFGVGVPNGAEAILHSANRFLNAFHDNASLAMLTVYFLTPLTWLIVRLSCGNEGPTLGLVLNIKKPEVFWPSCNGAKVQSGAFPSGIGRPARGVKLLGGAVSRDESFISTLAIKWAQRAVDLMESIRKLCDPQSELLLLRSCMGVAKLLFGLRTCQPAFVADAVSLFDKGLWGALEDIVVCGGPYFGDFQWRLASLPIRSGGLGLSSAEDLSAYAFVASRSNGWIKSVEWGDWVCD
ncbi:hypothetical protein CTI12_AA467910 [Artemisia annua]|uniref:Reverse transcriptase domain-containing protein n=1 Tax=Artemisia annua TaxID=35608 RepID=A0A2U1LPP8_ARTAN|nr:hypothetical protein CTI12_AA467910 [Artemisia annua]